MLLLLIFRIRVPKFLGEITDARGSTHNDRRDRIEQKDRGTSAHRGSCPPKYRICISLRPD